ncbi:O-antigen ligase family protein [Oleiagrimonas soli]|nr:O-antigen ligase family protein [Oleiagrimonas soli]
MSAPRSSAGALEARRLGIRDLLAVGLFWLPVGMALVPGKHASSVFHWTVALLLFVPSLACWIVDRGRCLRAVPRSVTWTCAVLLAWACVTLLWATGTHEVERIKVPLFVVLYLHAWLAWGSSRPGSVETLLRVTGWGMAFSALAAMLAFPWRDIVWTHRMVGFDMLDGPNLSAYAMGAAFVWLSQLPPSRGWRRVPWLIALALLAVFVAWTGSRGAWLALFVCLVSLPFWRPGLLARGFAVVGVLAAATVILLKPSLVLHRGLSYRPQIFERALAMIERHPWGGLGMGSKYTIAVGDQSWTHSHNLFTNIAIELGLPGLLLWLLLWAWIGWTGWRMRALPLGRIVLGVWIFASVALQFDGPSLLRSPRPEWLLTWLPLALAMLLSAMRTRHGMAGKAPVAETPQS